MRQRRCWRQLPARADEHCGCEKTLQPSLRQYSKPVKQIHIEFDREADGRYIAEATEMPGVMAYGATREEALALCEALALRVMADQLDSGEMPADSFQISISA